MARKAKPESPDRREDILRAAQEVFTESGFGAARIEDVARRAGVAKGTVYLYFESKEALFKALIQSISGPPIGAAEALIQTHGGSSEALLRAFVGILREQVLGTERRQIVRLVLTEVHRFPEIADYHYEHVVSRALGLLRAVIARGIERGEFMEGPATRFPLLVLAPFILSILWQGLFERRAPLDIDALFEAHFQMLIASLKGTAA